MLRRYLIDFDSGEIAKEKADFLVIGSGIAGLLAALRTSESGQVILVTKKELWQTNTVYAQGGIAAAVGVDDSPKLHFQDTLMAGAGHCQEEAVKVLVEEGPEGIEDLISLGVNFDRWGGQLALTREGAHSKRRILHAEGDASGREIMRALIAKVRENPQIKVAEYTLAVDLLTREDTCYGALVLAKGQPKLLLAQTTILATGGIGQLYEITTNPEVATGDGMAMAYRAGAQLSDMEFVQFHPTALCYPGAPHVLISEAVRGEGAYLRDKYGKRFMPEYHQLAELAPRDIVSRAIMEQMAKTNSRNVFLDLGHLNPEMVKERFPNIRKECAKYGIDILRDEIPVAPAAHYMMGGVKTDIWGQTNIKRLYACGEVARTGIHGANRLASNSLLEGLVFGLRVAEAAEKLCQEDYLTDLAKLSFVSSEPFEKKLISDLKAEKELLQKAMTQKVGIVRSREGLEEAKKTWQRLIQQLGSSEANTPEHIQLLDMVLVASLITEGALIREESRGGHYRLDYPQRDDQNWCKDIIFQRV